MSEHRKTETESIGGEVVLPSQFFRNWRGERTLKSAEGQLLVAVLADAVDCFQKHWGSNDPAGQRLFRDAERWIMDPPTVVGSDGPEMGFSFEYVCEVLNIDADRVRSALRRWIERQLRSGQAPRSAAEQRRV